MKPKVKKTRITPRRVQYEYGNPLGLLTDREHEVLCLIVCGATSREIGRMLTIQISTVEQHLGNIYDKIGAKNRTEAAIIAVRNHLQLSQQEEERIQDILYSLRKAAEDAKEKEKIKDFQDGLRKDSDLDSTCMP